MTYNDYFDELNTILHSVETDNLNFEATCKYVAESFVVAKNTDHKLIFIGNGGSAAIASHMATDYQKNGKMRAMALNDASMLTCLSNDMGYENVFSEQLNYHALVNDVVVLISSSGESQNIINAANEANTKGCETITLSGFSEDNRLRKMGRVNFFVPSYSYGVVEISHLTILHAILDNIIMESNKNV